jgi:hypothetical protein
MSLSFLTKGVLTGESDKENRDKEQQTSSQSADDQNDAESTTTSTRSRSKETNRTRLSLSFLRPSSPLEALPDFASNENISSVSRVASQKSRPDTSKSEKSDKYEAGRKGSVKKRLSFMSISKKSSKTSVRGRYDDVLQEE